VAGWRTCFLGLPLGVWSPIDAGFEDLVFALKLVLEFILELAHIVRLVVDVHRVRAIAALERASQLLVVCASFRHFLATW